jgi:hypothetical protein
VLCFSEIAAVVDMEFAVYETFPICNSCTILGPRGLDMAHGNFTELQFQGYFFFVSYEGLDMVVHHIFGAFQWLDLILLCNVWKCSRTLQLIFLYQALNGDA